MAASPSNRKTRGKVKRCVIGVVGLAVLLWMGKVAARAWMIHRATAPAARTQRIETLTQPPALPRVPWKYAFRNPSPEERTKLLRDILAVKLSTYSDRSAAARRAGKHRTMGFTGFGPTRAELETLASHYDVFYLGALSSHRIPLIKRRNPKAKALLYFACSLTKEARLADAGSVDEENTDWIEFLKTVAPRFSVPLVPNVEPVVLNDVPERGNRQELCGEDGPDALLLFHLPARRQPGTRNLLDLQRRRFRDPSLLVPGVRPESRAAEGGDAERQRPVEARFRQRNRSRQSRRSSGGIPVPGSTLRRSRESGAQPDSTDDE